MEIYNTKICNNCGAKMAILEKSQYQPFKGKYIYCTAHCEQEN